MGLVGFNPDLVVNSINNVQNAYNELIQAIGTDMQSQFVNGMQDKWASNNAQKFFGDVKNAVDALINESNNIFESIVDSMNSAANEWAKETGSAWSIKQFSRIEKKLDISGIQENINGVRGADPEVASIAAKLPNICNSAVSALSNAQSAVQNCGFVGGNQESQIIGSLKLIRNHLEESFNEISSACQMAIEHEVNNINDLNSKVSDAFGGGGNTHTNAAANKFNTNAMN